MEVWTSPTGRTVVVSPRGELDLATVVPLRRALTAAVEAPDLRLLVVDLAEVTFVDSTALGAFAGAARRAGARGTQVVLTHAHGIVARAVALTGLDFLLSPDERRDPARWS